MGFQKEEEEEVCVSVCFRASPPTHTLKLQAQSSRTIIAMKDFSGGGFMPLIAMETSVTDRHHPPKPNVLRRKKTACDSLSVNRLTQHQRPRKHMKQFVSPSKCNMTHIQTFSDSFTFLLLLHESADLHLFLLIIHTVNLLPAFYQVKQNFDQCVIT